MSDKPFDVGEEVWIIGGPMCEPRKARIKTKHAGNGNLRLEGEDQWYRPSGYIVSRDSWARTRLARDGDASLLSARRAAWLRSAGSAARCEFSEAVAQLRKLLEQAEELKP